MSVLAKTDWTVEEYLAFERASEEKHEYIDGDVLLMAGANRKHSLISVNILTSLHAQLRKSSCEMYISNMRLRVSATGNYLYPDVTAVCDTPQFEDKEFDTLLNPTLIIEVLSPSTEQYDRGKKFQTYRQLASLQEYVLISQNAYHIERYLRQEDGQWLFADVGGIEASLELASIGCTLMLADVYNKVTFESEVGAVVE